MFAEVGDLRGATEFAGHNDERVLQESLFVEIVEESGDTAIHRGEEFFPEVGEGVSVRVPGFVVTEIDLNEVDSGCDESGGHQEGPAERVFPVANELFLGGE